ncbi:MAG TPA: hypothetical protein VM327_11025 [Candidatus Thermoplasmatota archaeon]|nr:hypothetical protein [Candidatus Thermoplasmatota archaeon]
MATARADPLRSTLDNLQLDPRSAADRPYLVAMLRRLGYTEREIDEVVRTGVMPSQAPADDGLAPAREYRLVVPSGDSRFALDNTGAAAGDAPFEDLERVEFEDPSNDVVFESVGDGEDLQWQDEDQPGAPDERAGEGLEWQDTQAQGEQDAARALEEEAAALRAAEPGFEEGTIDTFGNPDAVGARAPTRVRVRRIRAASKEEAERKVSGGGRHVIKSVPVDIVERWGPGGDKAKQPPPPPPKEE